MSDSDAPPPKENILRIMDDFLSHLNRTKKLFMVLIFASFIIAPLSIVFAVLVLTPPFVSHAGQPFDVSVSFVGSSVEDKQIVKRWVGLNESNFTAGTIHHIPDEIGLVSASGQDVLFIRSGDLQNIDNQTVVFLKKPAVKLQYIPVGGVEAVPFAHVPPPRFMYVNDAGSFGRQIDVTPLIVIVVAVSAGLATTWLVLGLKEYKFFSNWNKRYSKYRRLQDEIDKELEE